jgi:hypothetical protein
MRSLSSTALALAGLIAFTLHAVAAPAPGALALAGKAMWTPTCNCLPF